MDIQLAQERFTNVTLKYRMCAVLALVLSFPLTKLPPSLIEKILESLAKNKEIAESAQAKKARDSICVVSKKCRNQDRCIKRSLATFFMLLIQGKKCSWCTGYTMNPFRSHAWIEVAGIPVGEPAEIENYTKVIKTTDIEAKDLKVKNEESNEKIVNDDSLITRVKLRDLFSLVSDRKKELVFIIILGIISSVLTLLQPEVMSNLVSGLNSELLNNVNFYLLIAIILFSTILTTFQYYILQSISEQAVFKSRENLINHILQLPIMNYSKWSSGDLLSRINGDTAKLRVGIIQLSVCITSGIVLSIGSAIGLFLRDVTLFAITLCTIIVSFVCIFVFSTFIQKASYNAQKGLGQLAGIVNRSLNGIRTIRSTNETQNEIKKSVGEAENLKKLGIKLAKYQSVMTPISNLGLQATGLVIIGIGGYRVSYGLMSIADLTAFVLLLYIAISPFQQIFSAISTAADTLGALARIKEITNLPTEDQYDIVLNEKNIKNNSAITFENVTFSYDKAILGKSNENDESNTILKDISFEISNGECVAIVGPSGAGKSTILQLIERFYELNQGTICINGFDYHLISREELRSQITYVEQNAPLLYGTIYENLTLGNEKVDENDCKIALEKVNLSYLIDRSPQGLHSVVGESGVGLSGGERQRLAMARALLSKANIILLDELTSNLDSINEKIIKKVVNELRGKKTIIIVAHRLSTTIDSDTIYVLEHGRIVGKGTHLELLNTVPLYKELAKEQMLI